jgi:hypothetical protein
MDLVGDRSPVGTRPECRGDPWSRLCFDGDEV